MLACSTESDPRNTVCPLSPDPNGSGTAAAHSDASDVSTVLLIQMHQSGRARETPEKVTADPRDTANVPGGQPEHAAVWF